MKKTLALTQSLSADMNTQRVVFKILVSSLVMLGMVYVYFIGSITFNVVARKSLENNMRELGSNVNNLELTYLSMSNSIDKNFALSNGFVDAGKPLFATRTSDTRVAVR